MKETIINTIGAVIITALVLIASTFAVGFIIGLKFL